MILIEILAFMLAHQQTLSLLAAAFLIGAIVATPNKRQFFE